MSKKKHKKTPPVLDSDQDYVAAFLADPEKKKKKSGSKPARVNRHGLPILEDEPHRFLEDPGEDDHDLPDEAAFGTLLDASLKEKTGSRSAPRAAVPLKKRLRRFPPPEADLDLHGFTALGAELKAKSFITTAMQHGYFTLRIIVGKGLHSEEGPVLPHVVEELLKTFKQEKLVLAYKWEKRKKSRSGAVIVYLNQFDD